MSTLIHVDQRFEVAHSQFYVIICVVSKNTKSLKHLRIEAEVFLRADLLKCPIGKAIYNQRGRCIAFKLYDLLTLQLSYLERGYCRSLVNRLESLHLDLSSLKISFDQATDIMDNLQGDLQ